IAVGNQKGGVGKTTNTVHLAAALGAMGNRCLIWDLDMNHGATLHLGVPPEAFDGTFMVLAEERTPEEVIIDEDEPDVELPPNVHLIPSSRDLERLEAVLAAKDRFYDPRRMLINPINGLRGRYDYIFLDTAPNATAPTIASYVAADWFIISVIPESFALNGMRECLKDIRRARQAELNPNLTLLGIIVSGLDQRITLARQYTAEINEMFQVEGSPSRMFQTTISRAAAVPRVQKAGKTLFQVDPAHKVAKQYTALAHEIEERVVALGSERQAAGQGV
ncbi:MAG: ParA family protein, partial [Acidobacteria bacterium]|nr:ParA family protein [Acidobacteriota bacterium]